MKNNDDQQEARDRGQGGYGFGTFKGVFTPSILTILGVIMYLRFGWVLGNVGLGRTLLIVTMATSITLLTGLSLSALATNRRVGGGGAYYIISRSLGLEPGAAVGVPLYLAQALGIAFYITGFSEALCDVVPLSPRLVGVATLVLLSALAYFSADLALRTQFVILALIAASLVSFFAGGRVEGLDPALGANAPPPVHFWAVFAVFFPAVTGIEAGLAMSGDLKKPARSLPLGTLAAVLTGYAVYMVIPLYLNWAVPDLAVLREDRLIMRHVAHWGGLILAGVWCASLSSAMGSLLGAPRTLQALARDRVLPTVIGRGFGANNDPRIATLITFGVALVGVLAGELNVIAPILSMFFLTSYGVLNVSAGLESIAKPPSWRPAFPVHFTVSLAGALACFSAMFMINAGATLVAGAVVVGVYTVMKRRKMRKRWGDMQYGILMTAAKAIVRRLADRDQDERTWQPNLLVFSGSPATRWYLVSLATAIARDHAFLTVATVLPDASMDGERIRSATNTVRDYLRKRGVNAFVRIVPAANTWAGAIQLINAYGFGPLSPNTYMLGETENPAHFLAYAAITRRVHAMRKNLIIVRESKETTEPVELEEGSRIDVWWRGQHHNIGFLITLAYLMKQSEGWGAAEIRVKSIVDAGEDTEDTAAHMREYLARQRILAEVEVFEKTTEDVFDRHRSLPVGLHDSVERGRRLAHRFDDDSVGRAEALALPEESLGNGGPTLAPTIVEPNPIQQRQRCADLEFAAQCRDQFCQRLWLLDQLPDSRADPADAIVFTPIDAHHHQIAVHFHGEQVRVAHHAHLI